MNKRKSVLFTITTFIIGLFVLALFSSISYKDYLLESKVNTIKILNLNELFRDYEQYSEFMAMYSLRKSFDKEARTVINSGFIKDNETLYQNINGLTYIIFDKSMNSLTKMLTDQGINTSYSINDLRFIGLKDTWNLLMYVNLTLRMDAGYVKWDTTIEKNISVPINGLIDPYISSTVYKGREIKRIRFIKEYPANPTYEDFKEFKENGLYRSSYDRDPPKIIVDNETIDVYPANGPNFLDRFLGLNTSKEYGIETLLNESIVGDYNLSYIDFLFIANVTYFDKNDQLLTVSEYKPFKIDSTSATYYMGEDVGQYVEG